MSGNSPKVSHLSVVKPGSQPEPVQIVTVENLSSADRSKAEKYVSSSKLDGILVGALLRELPWNLKPLVLDRGMLRVVRFTDPALSLDSWRYRSFEMQLKQFESWSKGMGGSEIGESGGQYWYKRNFFQRTLAELAKAEEAELKVHPVALAQKIIRMVSRWEEDGIVHGHLCRANIVVENGEPQIIDPLVTAFAPELAKVSSDIAPELQKGDVPTHAADLFGLGKVLLYLLADVLTARHQELIAALLSPSPLSRPIMKVVQETFGAERLKVREPDVDLRLGKVITEPVEPAVSEVVDFSVPATSSRSHEEAVEYLRGTAVLGSDMVERIRNAIDSEAGIERPKEKEKRVEEPHRPSSKVRRPLQVRHIAILGTLILAVAIFFGLRSHVKRLLFEPSIPNGKYQEFWTSGDASKMRAVARAAAGYRNLEAEQVVVQDAIAGSDRQGVRGDVLRLVFDKRWAKDLTAEDREIALKLAVGELLPEVAQDVPPLYSVHPSVLLAIVGNLRADDDGRAVAGIPLSRMYALAPPFGESFRKLEVIGVKDFGSPAARALAALLAGRMTPDYLDKYFNANDDAVASVGKLRLLREARSTTADFAMVYETLLASTGLLTDYLKWFEAERPGLWKGSSLEEKLDIASGDIPGATLSMERYADLLTFPLALIRQSSAEILGREYFPENMRPIIEILASPENKFTRMQTVTLLAAFGLDGEPRFSFISKWFKTNPDAGTTLKVLIARRDVGSIDPFCVEGARYLKSKSWEPTKEQLDQLLIHPEPLVRALGYIRLDPDRPDDVKILKNMMRVETNTRLREEIGKKLKLKKR